MLYDSTTTLSLDFEAERLAAGEASAALYNAAKEFGTALKINSPGLPEDWSDQKLEPDLVRQIDAWLKDSLPQDEAARNSLGPAIWNRIAQIAAIAGEHEQACEFFGHVLGRKIQPKEKLTVLSSLLQVQQKQGRMDAVAETRKALAEVEGLFGPTVYLRVVRGKLSGMTFDVHLKRVVIGRHQSCDIALDVGALSRQHSELYWQKDQLWIKDLRSRNGTIVNDLQIKEPRCLKNRDIVKICEIELEVTIPSLMNETPAAAPYRLPSESYRPPSTSIFDEEDESPALAKTDPEILVPPSLAEPKTAVPAPSTGPDSVLGGGLPVPAPQTAEDGPPRPYLDEHVQFTVFRPQAVRPGKWYPLLAFAHLSEKPPGAAEDEPDPVQEVQRQARQLLDDQWDAYLDQTQDGRMAVPRDGELTLVPEMSGVRFNPPQRTFLWQEAVHREEFRLQAGEELEGKTARGRMTVFLGNLVLAEISLTMRVNSSVTPVERQPLAPVSTQPYRKIFASYSHADLSIVEEIERYTNLLGDEYLRDWKHLRSGQVWNDRLMEMIREADVFQLFWSSNSMASKYVRQEWEYALSLNRPSFVRPTYWEDPMPEMPHVNLPPEELRRLHFQRIPAAIARRVTGSPGSSCEPGAEQVSIKTIHPSPPVRSAPIEMPWQETAGGGTIPDFERETPKPPSETRMTSPVPSRTSPEVFPDAPRVPQSSAANARNASSGIALGVTIAVVLLLLIGAWLLFR